MREFVVPGEHTNDMRTSGFEESEFHNFDFGVVVQIVLPVDLDSASDWDWDWDWDYGGPIVFVARRGAGSEFR